MLLARYERFLRERRHDAEILAVDLVEAGFDGGAYPGSNAVREVVDAIDARGLRLSFAPTAPLPELPSDEGLSFAQYARRFAALPVLNRSAELRVAFTLELAAYRLARCLFRSAPGRSHAVATLRASTRDDRIRGRSLRTRDYDAKDDAARIQELAALVEALEASGRDAQRIAETEAPSVERARRLEALRDGDASLLLSAELDWTYVLDRTEALLENGARLDPSYLRELDRRYRELLDCMAALVAQGLLSIGRVLLATSESPTGPRALAQAAMDGLWQASVKYPPRREYRFATHAAHWAAHHARKAGATVAQL